MVRKLSILCCLVLLASSPAGGQDIDAQGRLLGQPGFLILTAARDTTAGYHRQSGPGAGHESLVWDGGQLVIPDTLALEPFGERDLGVRTTAQLQGSGGSGLLDFRDGRFAVDQPLLLTDGVISLYVARGQLEIRGAQIRYIPPISDQSASAKKPPDPRAGFLFLAGLIVMIVVLMRMARLRARGRKT